MAIMGLRERTSVGLDAHDLLDIAVIGVATFVMAVAVLSWAFPLDGAAETSKARTVKRQRGVRRDQASQGATVVQERKRPHAMRCPPESYKINSWRSNRDFRSASVDVLELWKQSCRKAAARSEGMGTTVNVGTSQGRMCMSSAVFLSSEDEGSDASVPTIMSSRRSCAVDQHFEELACAQMNRMPSFDGYSCSEACSCSASNPSTPVSTRSSA